MIRVALVEDDAEIRAGFCELINAAPGFRCILALPEGEAALREIPAARPDVVLMDIQMPGQNGIEIVRQLHARDVSLRIIMLTVHNDAEALFRALKAGASGYLLKRTAPEKLLEAIQEAHQGGAPMSRQIARQVVEYFRTMDNTSTAAESILTPREKQVLALLSEGFLYKEIAEQMDVSMNTIRTFIRNIYEKLHVNSRSQAVNKYFRLDPGKSR